MPDRGVDALDHRAHHARQRRSARRPRRAARPGHGPAAVGCARSAAAASRGRDSSRRPVGAVAVDPGLGRAAARRSNGSIARRTDRIASAMSLLARLGAIEGGRVTAARHAMQRLPLQSAAGARAARGRVRSKAARVRVAVGADAASTAARGDIVRPAADHRSVARMPPHLRQVAENLERMAAQLLGDKRIATDRRDRAAPALLAGYRIASRGGAAADRA